MWIRYSRSSAWQWERNDLRSAFFRTGRGSTDTTTIGLGGTRPIFGEGVLRFAFSGLDEARDAVYNKDAEMNDTADGSYNLASLAWIEATTTRKSSGLRVAIYGALDW